jgi:chemotaxis protein CheX
MAAATQIQKIVLDEKFLAPFIAGTIKTFKVQCTIDLTPGKPSPKAASPAMEASITGVIAINCSAFNGNVAIIFPEQTFLNVYEKMIGEKHTQISEEIRDGAGELINIIYGQVKSDMNAAGFNLQKAIPTVTHGKGIQITHGKAQAMTVPFTSEQGNFVLEISLAD